MSMRMRATFSSELASGVVVEITTDNGEVSKKLVSFNSFIEALHESKVQSGKSLKIGKMPKGYYDGAIDPSRENSFICTIVIEGTNQIVQHCGEVYDIPFPTLVFGFKTVEGRIIHSLCFAVKGKEVTDQSELYHFPFSNVYSGGRICWGANNLDSITSFKDFEKIIVMFYGLPSNNDLFAPGKNIKHDDMTLSLTGFYKLLDKKQDFPEHLLEPVDNKMCDLMNRLEKSN